MTRPTVSTRGRRSIVLGLLAASATLTLSAGASASNYPACNAQSNAFCSMPDTGNKDVLTGGIDQENGVGANEGSWVGIYPIFYGVFNTPYHYALMNAVLDLIPLLADSVYEATTETYTGPTGAASGRLIRMWQGAVDSSFQFGKTMDIPTALEEINYQIRSAEDGFEDTQGVYLIIAGDGVSFPGYCNGECGYNDKGQVGQSTLHFAVLGADQSCQHCRWGVPTPHDANGADPNGVIDFILSSAAHEINEIITDPFGGKGGWYSSTTGSDNRQMADFCSNQSGPIVWHTSTGASTNFNAWGEDFYLQPLRVNAASDGSLGYCVMGYGGVFWNQNFGYSWTPTHGDWSPGNYKGECEGGQALVGLSQYQTGLTTPGKAHAVMCGRPNDPTQFPQSTSCTPRPWNGSTPGTNTCLSNEFAAGIAQSTSGRVNSLLCCPLGNGETQTACTSMPFDGQNVANSATPYDWDWGYFKAECLVDQFVTGVTTANNASGQLVPSAITCCTPY